MNNRAMPSAANRMRALSGRGGEGEAGSTGLNKGASDGCTLVSNCIFVDGSSDSSECSGEGCIDAASNEGLYGLCVGVSSNDGKTSDRGGMASGGIEVGSGIQQAKPAKWEL